MSFFNRLFQKEKPKEIPAMPPWEEIVEMMYDKCLDAFTAEVVRVVYSIDKTMRYVVLRYEQGLYTYQLEAIYKLDKVMNGDIQEIIDACIAADQAAKLAKMNEE